jgi:integrase
MQLSRVPTGSVYRREGARRPVWYARYRLPDGREVRRRVGPAWTGRGRPAAGFFTHQSAEAWLADILGEARRGTLPGMVRTGATFADAAAEYLRYVEHDRGRKRSTLFDYESVLKTHLLPAFGQRRLEDITTAAIEGWRAEVSLRRRRDRPLTARTRNKMIVVLHGIFRRACKVWSLPLNPVAQIERFPELPSGEIDVFSAEEIHALVRATPDPQDAAMFATAALTGLRMGELRALRWRDVDFVRCVVRVRGSYAMGELTTPKSGKVRSVPLIDGAARLLAVLAQRSRFTGETIWSSATRSAAGSATTASAGATPPRSPRRSCARRASTTFATPSGASQSPAPTSSRSRHGWATPTSRRGCATSTAATAARQPDGSTRPLA